MKTAALTILIFGILFVESALAEEGRTSCYKFEVPNDSANVATPLSQEEQLWCYETLLTAEDSLFIYNADDTEVRPELSVLVNDEGIITHASLLAGEITYHRVDSKEFNPFPIPMTEPKDKIPYQAPDILKLSAQNTLQQLRLFKPQILQSLQVMPGLYRETAQSRVVPWRGYWWPYQDAPLYKDGPRSPLGKFDAFVAVRDPQKAQAHRWESANHVFKGIWWEGHCNGWVAAAILREEPKRPRRDPLSRVTFSVDDQKGILSVKDYCTVTSFYGKRNRGRTTDDPSDIYPHIFHRVLLYYIGQLGKPVAIDYRSDSVVDNHIISGYEMDITSQSPGVYNVEARLQMRMYDSSRGFPPGPAPLYTRIYSYTLYEDENGQINSGTWRSPNPDFLWVPLAPAHCGSNNPYVREEFVRQIINLPFAGNSLESEAP